jgi:hypothetical protein
MERPSAREYAEKFDELFEDLASQSYRDNVKVLAKKIDTLSDTNDEAFRRLREGLWVGKVYGEKGDGAIGVLANILGRRGTKYIDIKLVGLNYLRGRLYDLMYDEEGLRKGDVPDLESLQRLALQCIVKEDEESRLLDSKLNSDAQSHARSSINKKLGLIWGDGYSQTQSNE